MVTQLHSVYLFPTLNTSVWCVECWIVNYQTLQRVTWLHWCWHQHHSPEKQQDWISEGISPCLVTLPFSYSKRSCPGTYAWTAGQRQKKLTVWFDCAKTLTKNHAGVPNSSSRFTSIKSPEMNNESKTAKPQQLFTFNTSYLWRQFWVNCNSQQMSSWMSKEKTQEEIIFKQ